MNDNKQEIYDFIYSELRENKYMPIARWAPGSRTGIEFYNHLGELNEKDILDSLQSLLDDNLITLIFYSNIASFYENLDVCVWLNSARDIARMRLEQALSAPSATE